jgi:hypothetical protein
MNVLSIVYNNEQLISCLDNENITHILLWDESITLIEDKKKKFIYKNELTDIDEVNKVSYDLLSHLPFNKKLVYKNIDFRDNFYNQGEKVIDIVEKINILHHLLKTYSLAEVLTFNPVDQFILSCMDQEIKTSTINLDIGSQETQQVGPKKKRFGHYFDLIKEKVEFFKEMCVKNKQNKPGKKEIRYLVIGSTLINYTKALIPVAKTIQDHEQENVQVLVFNDAVHDKFDEEKIKTIRIGNFISKFDIIKLIFNTVICAGIGYFQSRKNEYSKYTYKNVPIFKLIKINIVYIYTFDIPMLILLIDLYKKILSKYSISNIIVADDIEPRGRIPMQLGQGKIKTYNIQHGSIMQVYNYNKTIADNMFVWGKYSKELLSRSGVNENKLIVSGNPAFDYIKQRAFNKDKLVKDIFNLPYGGEKIILWTPNVDDSDPKNLERLVTQLKDSELLENKLFIVKLHPLEDKSKYVDALNKYKLDTLCKLEVIEDYNIYDLLFISDLLIAFNTSTIFEALIFNKPILSVNLNNKKGNTENLDRSINIEVDNKLDIYDIGNKLLDPNNDLYQRMINNQKQVLEYTLYKMDGDASLRIYNYISAK